jgi:hypothetical protein
MTIEEENQYYKTLIQEVSDAMDRNALILYKWEKVAEKLVNHLEPYLKWPEDKEMLEVYSTLKDYHSLKNEIRTNKSKSSLTYPEK